MQHVFVEFVTFVKWNSHTNVTNAASKTLAVVHPPLFMDMEDRFEAKKDVCCQERKKGKEDNSSLFISGETELEDEFDSCTDTLWIDMPMVSRIFHVIKQVETNILQKITYQRKAQ